ncbi:MAG: carboxypeptidase-like regulatory domain-containing protein [Acidobacteriota bacterium]|nr:carboxypeptidase-like regulatory domain-containing protein [Acidobacteriota bacterium]
MDERARVRIPAALLAVAALAAACGESANLSPPPTAPGRATLLYTLSGVVSEPAGDVVQGAHVQVGAKNATTDHAGRYSVGELFGSVAIQVSKDGYETQVAGAVIGGDRTLDVTLPPLVRIAAGSATTITLYPSERAYSFPISYEECYAPCKMIRVSAAERGSLAVTLTAQDVTTKLNVLVYEGSLQYCCAAEITTRPFEIHPTADVVLYVTIQGRTPATAQRIGILTSFQPR